MNPQRLRPEIRNRIKRLPRIPFANPSLLPLSRLLYNLGSRTKRSPEIKVESVLHDGVPIRVFSTHDNSPSCGILWCFGGGHLAGKPKHLNAIASLAVLQLNAIVVIPDYRLAPEYPFPSDLLDCFKAWEWLKDLALASSFSIQKLAIAGHSAGGGLAAALAQLILDRGGIQPAAQCLFYPMLDDRTVNNQELSSANHFIWNNQANQVAWDAYLSPYTAGDDEIPEYAAAARRTNLTGLPPTWIGQCELDLFFNEYEHYSQRLQHANVPCETYFVDGVPHAFEVLFPQLAISKTFNDAAIKFLKKYLG